MNSSQHRALKRIRDDLVDSFELARLAPKGASVAEIAAQGGLDEKQHKQICEIAAQLWDLMLDDPYPPECQQCGISLPTPAVPTLWGGTLKPGRARKYCSDKCRQAAYRDRLA